MRLAIWPKSHFFLQQEAEMIALDGMGGDFAPDVVVRAALRAAQQSIPIMIFGPSSRITSLLFHYDACWESYPLTVYDAPEEIFMHDDPVASVRKKNRSSLVQAVLSVKQGVCHAVVSAGSTGALMVASTLILGRQEGIERPAIAGFLPTKKGKVLVLDLGANTDLRPHHLVQFAQMGSDYLSRLMGIDRPRVALLANGHEEGKGTMLVKEAHQLLKQSPLNFIGNAEPEHVMDHAMDVVVCDGFSGNILLKTCETVTDTMNAWLIQSFDELLHNEASPRLEYGLSIKKRLQGDLHARLNYKQDGGALLLGVQGTVIVCHGNSDAQLLEQALIFTWNIIKNSNFQNENFNAVQL